MTCHAYRASSETEDTTQAKANIVVAIGRIVVVPIGNVAVVGIVVPATAQVSHPGYELPSLQGFGNSLSPIGTTV